MDEELLESEERIRSKGVFLRSTAPPSLESSPERLPTDDVMRLDAGALPPTAREGLSVIPRDFFAAERTRVEDRLLGASLLGSSSSSSNCDGPVWIR